MNKPAMGTAYISQEKLNELFGMENAIFTNPTFTNYGQLKFTVITSEPVEGKTVISGETNNMRAIGIKK